MYHDDSRLPSHVGRAYKSVKEWNRVQHYSYEHSPHVYSPNRRVPLTLKHTKGTSYKHSFPLCLGIMVIMKAGDH